VSLADEPHRATAMMIDDRTDKGTPATPGRTRGDFPLAEARGGKQFRRSFTPPPPPAISLSFGLSVINYPIVKLSARRYRQHGVSSMILSLSRVTRASV